MYGVAGGAGDYVATPQTCHSVRRAMGDPPPPPPPGGGSGGNPGGGADPNGPGTGTDRCIDHPDTPGLRVNHDMRLLSAI